jgi:hypothetical protein
VLRRLHGFALQTFSVVVLAAVTLAIEGTVSSVAWADCSDPFAHPGTALDFHFKLKRTDWMALLASSVPSTDGNSAACDAKYPEFRAEFRCGTEGAWMKIALRKKRGEERGAEAPLKPPLKMDFNEDFMGQVPEAKGQSWPAGMGDFGYRKLTLNNGQGNKPPGRTLMLPNLLSEHVALRLLKREVPTSPATAIATVTLYFDDNPTGEFHGSYILIEDIDKSALRRRFGRGDGRLQKASKAGCPIEQEFDDGPPNEAKAAFDSFMAKSPAAFSGRWQSEAEKGLELDQVLRQEAIREILVNGDDTLFYAGPEGNNWYSFDPRQGKRHYMPWDVDLTFGQQQQNCAPNSLKCLPSFPISRFCNGSRLGAATACNAEIQKRYYQIMCQLTQGSLSAGEIIKVWDEADRAARPGVTREKDLIWRGMDPLSTSIDKSYGAEYVRLRAWIPERIRSVQQQLTTKGVACGAGCPAGANESCQYLTCPGQRRCDNGLWSVCEPMPGCALPNAKPVGPVSDAGAAGGAGGENGQGGQGGAGGAGERGDNDAGGGRPADSVDVALGGEVASGGGGSGGSAAGGGSGGRARNGGSGSVGAGGSTGPEISPARSGGGCHYSRHATDPSIAASLLTSLLVLGLTLIVRRRFPRA